MTYKPRNSKNNPRNPVYGGSGGQIPSAGEIYALPTPPPTPVKKGKYITVIIISYYKDKY